MVRLYLSAAALLLIHSVAALSLGVQSNSTLKVGDIAQDPYVEYTAVEKPAFSGNEKRHPKNKPEVLTPEQQKNKEIIQRKTHNNDDFAKWANKPNLRRGKYWSRSFRLTLYKNPGKIIADRGVGLGKAWSADGDGFIHDRSEELEKLPAVVKQKYGFIPKKNRRLPPRPGMNDPTMLFDPPPAVSPTKLHIIADKFEELVGAHPAEKITFDDTITVDGVEVAVFSATGTTLAASPTPAIFTVDGHEFAEVSTAETATPADSAPVATAATATATSTNSDDAIATTTKNTRVHARQLSGNKGMPDLAKLLPKLKDTQAAKTIAQTAWKEVVDGSRSLANAISNLARINTAAANAASSEVAGLADEAVVAANSAAVDASVGAADAAVIASSEGAVAAGAELATEASVAGIVGGAEAGLDAAVIGSELGAEIGAGVAAEELALVSIEWNPPGAIVAGAVILVTVIATLLHALITHLMHKKHYPKNPGGHLGWAWDWDGRPYQTDNEHPEISSPRPTPTPPVNGCDTFDMPALEARGWTTTQYARYPCPTWVPQECTKEWFRDYRMDPKKGGNVVKGKDPNSRHNPNYCFEYWGFNPAKKYKKESSPAYQDALKKSNVAEYAQYAGHVMAEKENCLGFDKHDHYRMQNDQRCRQKFLPKMKHHNLRTKDCEPEQCELQVDMWRYMTSGWPKDCEKKKANDGRCWADWGSLGGKNKRSDEVQDMLFSNITMEPTPTTVE